MSIFCSEEKRMFTKIFYYRDGTEILFVSQLPNPRFSQILIQNGMLWQAITTNM
jgi:hypothetical protein